MQHGWRGYNFNYWFTWGLLCCRRNDWKAPSSSFFPDNDDDPGKSLSMHDLLESELQMSWLDSKTTFIAIAIIITMSSASKLQSKAGLPLVNQVVGWVVLGDHILRLTILVDIDPFLPQSYLPSFHSFTRAGGLPYHQNFWCIFLGLVPVSWYYLSVRKACFMWHIRLLWFTGSRWSGLCVSEVGEKMEIL